jgi:hypothetical protein
LLPVILFIFTLESTVSFFSYGKGGKKVEGAKSLERRNLTRTEKVSQCIYMADMYVLTYSLRVERGGAKRDYK